MTKKMTAILLACILMLSCASGLCETTETSSTTDFTCTITAGVVPTDPDETLNSSLARAKLTVSLLMDLLVTSEDSYVADHLMELADNESFVLSDGQFFCVAMHSGGDILSIFYDPQNQQASYVIQETGLSSDAVLRTLEGLSDKYPHHYQNDSDDVWAVLKAISEGLQDE